MFSAGKSRMLSLGFLAFAVPFAQVEGGASQTSEELPWITVEADAWYAGAPGWIFITRGSRPGTATRAREGNEFRLVPRVLPVGNASFNFWDHSALGFQ